MILEGVERIKESSEKVKLEGSRKRRIEKTRTAKMKTQNSRKSWEMSIELKRRGVQYYKILLEQKSILKSLRKEKRWLG